MPVPNVEFGMIMTRMPVFLAKPALDSTHRRLRAGTMLGCDGLRVRTQRDESELGQAGPLDFSKLNS